MSKKVSKTRFLSIFAEKPSAKIQKNIYFLGKVKNGTKSPPTRSKSPKFFVTLHEGDKKKKIKTKDSKNIIINPSDSDDDSDNTINENSNAIKTAEKIKQQQEQNNALVSLNNQVNIFFLVKS